MKKFNPILIASILLLSASVQANTAVSGYNGESSVKSGVTVAMTTLKDTWNSERRRKEGIKERKYLKSAKGKEETTGKASLKAFLHEMELVAEAKKIKKEADELEKEAKKLDKEVKKQMKKGGKIGKKKAKKLRKKAKKLRKKVKKLMKKVKKINKKIEKARKKSDKKIKKALKNKRKH
jgi:ElaB/YqjD/DUF883 family membrane-anchored ribosome-binding protein